MTKAFLKYSPGAQRPVLIRDPSWEDLLQELEKVRDLGPPLSASWYAYDGREDYGIWLLHPGGPRPEEYVASFSLFAAKAIATCGRQPIPVPQPLEHCPHWKTITEVFARPPGKSLDFSAVVPHGLGTVDLDAVDPYTRGWLELLRHESRDFQITSLGREIIGGTEYSSVVGRIEDVCTASAIYIKRRARNEIASRVPETAKESEVQTPVAAAIQPGEAPTTDWRSSPTALKRRTPREIVDAVKRRLTISYEKFASRIGISKDTLYAIIGETKWVSDDSYYHVAKACNCEPEDLHPCDIPRPARRRRP